jgi:hypothetical protein
MQCFMEAANKEALRPWLAAWSDLALSSLL